MSQQQQQPPFLIGFIEYRLGGEVSSSRSCSSNSKSKRPFTTKCEPNGFVFLPSVLNDDDNNDGSCYQLIIPQVLLVIACNATRFHSRVLLTVYTQLSIPINDTLQGIIEVHNGGLTLLNNPTNTSPTTNNAMTLSEFQSLETTQKLNKQTTYSITAMVDAVSPIINSNNYKPFALVEVYDENTNTATIVIKGSKAVTIQPAIQPGSKITIINAKRQKWHVWQSFLGLKDYHNRAPQYVFVVTDPTYITFFDSAESSKNNKPMLPPLPSTVDSLTAIEGTIVSVEYDLKSRIQFLIICSCHNEENCKLYVAHYPMTFDLVCGLRNGAQIRAVNIQYLYTNMAVLATSLRSTLTLTYCASESIVSPAEAKSRLFNNCQSHHHLLTTNTNTYQDMEWCHEMCTKWFTTHSSPSRVIFAKLLHQLFTKKKQQQQQQRNVYQEFYNPIQPIKKYPTIQSISTIHNACLQQLKQALVQHHYSELEIGWVASLQLARITDTMLVTGGIIEAIDATRNAITRVKNEHCSLSCSPLLTNDSKFSSNVGCTIGDFCLLGIHAVFGSCLYLGTTRQEQPSVNNNSKGPSAIFCIQNHVFILSIQMIHNKQFVSYQKTTPTTTSRNIEWQNLVQLEPFLTGHTIQNSSQNQEVDTTTTTTTTSSSTTKGDEDKYLIGCLVRQRWKIRKQKYGLYNGSVMTLSHVNPQTRAVCQFQSIDLKLMIPCCQDRDSTTAADVISLGLHADISTMALAWYHLAQDGRTCPLLACGWDEFCSDNTNNNNYTVYVQFPVSSCGVQRKTGRLHFESNSSLIRTFLNSDTSSGSNYPTTTTFTHIGGRKVLPGMLSCRTIPRKLFRQKQKTTTAHCGEATTVASTNLAGVTPVSIAEIHAEIYQNVKVQLNFLSAPSLVRVLVHTRLIKLSFCRARAECTRCFSVLTKHTNNNDWMVCPSGCKRLHASIKWECSGVVQDGTGHAKLYAERDTALILLGKGLEVDLVEQAAWQKPLGVTFIKQVPPNHDLKRAVYNARSQALVQRQQKNTLDFLSKQEKGEYELQRFCRESREPFRELDLVVRCKPVVLSGEGLIDHTELVTMSIKGNEFATLNCATLKLPILELSLVDCIQSNETVELGWDLVRALKT